MSNFGCKGMLNDSMGDGAMAQAKTEHEEASALSSAIQKKFDKITDTSSHIGLCLQEVWGNKLNEFAEVAKITSIVLRVCKKTC